MTWIQSTVMGIYQDFLNGLYPSWFPRHPGQSFDHVTSNYVELWAFIQILAVLAPVTDTPP